MMPKDFHLGATQVAAMLPLLLGLLVATAPRADAADRIILRNLEILSDRTVTAFDADGVRLDDGKQLGWDEIEQAEVSAAQQAEFDRLLAELGGPLYRIRQRLSVGDYRGLLSPAEAVYPRYADRDSPTAYMVIQSLMWGRLAAGRREDSLEPYLRCCEYQRKPGRTQVSLPGQRRLEFDPETGLSSDLVPIWFDAEAANISPDYPTPLAVLGYLFTSIFNERF